jgi:hypothetical protein
MPEGKLKMADITTLFDAIIRRKTLAIRRATTINKPPGSIISNVHGICHNRINIDRLLLKRHLRCVKFTDTNTKLPDAIREQKLPDDFWELCCLFF